MEASTSSHSALVHHLSSTLGMSHKQATRAVQEMFAYFDETPEAFVRRRHLELRADDVANARAFALISAELQHTRFCVAPLSDRQIRRIIYG